MKFLLMNNSFLARYSLSLILAILLCGCQLSSKVVYYPKSRTSAPDRLEATQRPYTIDNKTYYPISSAYGYRKIGIASWYGKKFHGRNTASGERYDMHARTAAHKTLPMNTMLLVRNLENGRETVVRINDRGPFTKKRIIDLSYQSASELDIVKDGTAKVEIIALAEDNRNVYANSRQERHHDLKLQDFDSGIFYIQTGSFTVRTYAERLAGYFAERGRDVTIQKFDNGEVIFYRVLVFAGKSLRTAKILEDEFSKEGYPDSFVIAR